MIAAFIAGVFSFLSPCVLPLVPGYMALISGASVEQLQSKDQKAIKTALLHSIMFILGFTVVFVTLGAAATGLGQLAQQYRKYLTWIGGALIIVFGLHLIGVFKIKTLYMDKRLHSVGGGESPIAAFVVGFAFAFGWTPCIGPVLAGILGLAADSGQVGKGILLLWIYSMGLALPFLLTALFIGRFLQFYDWFKRHLRKVEVASGVLLIVLGALIMTRHFTVLAGYLGFLNRFAL